MRDGRCGWSAIHKERDIFKITLACQTPRPYILVSQMEQTHDGSWALLRNKI